MCAPPIGSESVTEVTQVTLPPKRPCIQLTTPLVDYHIKVSGGVVFSRESVCVCMCMHACLHGLGGKGTQMDVKEELLPSHFIT